MSRASTAADAIRDAEHFALWEPVNGPQMQRDAARATPIDILIARAAGCVLTGCALAAALLLALQR